MDKTLSKQELQEQIIPCKESIDQLCSLVSSSDPIIDKDSPSFKELETQVDSLVHIFWVLQRELDYLK